MCYSLPVLQWVFISVKIFILTIKAGISKSTKTVHVTFKKLGGKNVEATKLY